MPRITQVKSGKKPRRCSGCGGEIPAGASYKWFKMKTTYGGVRRDFHTECRIRPSMMTLSPHRQGILSAVESAEDALDSANTLDEFAQIVRDYGEAIREVGEGYRESADNMEEGFGHETYQSQELAEKADACEALADELDSQADEIEGMDDPDADEEDFEVDDFEFDPETEKPLDPEGYAEAIQEQRNGRREAARELAYEAIGEEPEV